MFLYNLRLQKNRDVHVDTANSMALPMLISSRLNTCLCDASSATLLCFREAPELSSATDPLEGVLQQAWWVAFTQHFRNTDCRAAIS